MDSSSDFFNFQTKAEKKLKNRVYQPKIVNCGKVLRLINLCGIIGLWSLKNTSI